MNEKIVGLLGSDSVVPQQYFDAFRRSERLELEKALLLAILEDAMHCFRKYSVAKDGVGNAQFQEAKNRIMHPGDDCIFSFDNVCGPLGLELEYIRRGFEDCRAPTVTGERGCGRSGSRMQAA